MIAARQPSPAGHVVVPADANLLRNARIAAKLGPRLARRLHDVLGVDTLEALETATHEGRFDMAHGIGRRRMALIRNALSEMLGHVRPRSPGDANPVQWSSTIKRAIGASLSPVRFALNAAIAG